MIKAPPLKCGRLRENGICMSPLALTQLENLPLTSDLPPTPAEPFLGSLPLNPSYLKYTCTCAFLHRSESLCLCYSAGQGS